MQIMRVSLAIAAILFFSGIAFAQNPTKYQIENATGPCKIVLVKNNDPLDSFHKRPEEIYRNSPVVSFSIDPNGNIVDAKLVRSSGIKRLDDLVLGGVKKEKFKPRAPQCGTVDTQIDLTIHWE